MTHLATEAEAAAPEQTRELLEQAFATLRGRPFVWLHADGDRETTDPLLWAFTRKLDAEAYLDAAVMLMPEGWSAKLYLHPGENHAEVYKLGEIIHTNKGSIRPFAAGCSPREGGPSATPALALLAAICRAQPEGDA